MMKEHQQAWELVRSVYPDLDLEKSPLCFSEHSLRFELGDVLPNCSTRRIEQAVARACTLFESCFDAETEVVLLVEDWEQGPSRQMFPTTPAGYLERLMPGLAGRLVVQHAIDTDDMMQAETSVLLMEKCQVNAEAIFRGKANLEMGRDPAICHSLYFIGVKTGLVFYMYDDRGCLIYARTKRELAALRRQYGAWLVVPGRVCGN